MWTGVMLALALTLVLQVVAQSRGMRDPPSGPTTGRVIPSVTVTDLADSVAIELRHFVRQQGVCALIAIVSTRCHVCARMRWTWSAQTQAWADSIGRPVNLLWLAAEPAESLRSFVSGFDFEATSMNLIVGDKGATLRRLGIFATPTIYLADYQGRLRFGIVGDHLPPVPIAQAVCHA